MSQLIQKEGITLVEVPKNVERFDVFYELGHHPTLDLWLGKGFSHPDDTIKLPDNRWEIIGLSHLLSPEQKEKCVESRKLIITKYRDYLHDENLGWDYFKFNDPNDSYSSWLDSLKLDPDKQYLILKNKL